MLKQFVSGTKYDVACVVLQMVYGLVRGMRFWDFNSAMQTWAWLLPVFQQVRIIRSYLNTINYSQFRYLYFFIKITQIPIFHRKDK
jgi:hypothetical protein